MLEPGHPLQGEDSMVYLIQLPAQTANYGIYIDLIRHMCLPRRIESNSPPTQH